MSDNTRSTEIQFAKVCEDIARIADTVGNLEMYMLMVDQRLDALEKLATSISRTSTPS